MLGFTKSYRARLDLNIDVKAFVDEKSSLNSDIEFTTSSAINMDVSGSSPKGSLTLFANRFLLIL
jgi:hypothetical protein